MKKKSYLINFSAARNPGTINYCINFIKFLPAESNIYLTIVLPPNLIPLVKKKLPAYVSVYSNTYFKYSFLRFCWEQLLLPLLLLSNKFTSILSPFDIAPILSPTPILLGVKNPMPIHMSKGWHSNKFRHRSRAFLQYLLAYLSTAKAQKIYYSSSFAALKLGELFNINKNKIYVINHGVDHEYWDIKTVDKKILAKYNLLDGSYILFVSMLYHYKRADFLIESFHLKINFFIKNNIKLVIVGGKSDPKYFMKIEKYIISNKLEDFVLLLGFVEKQELPHLYKGARAFCLPTNLETFGQPFVEAMSAGTPIIAANIEIVKEICEEACLYFDVNSNIDLSDKLVEIFLNEKLFKKLVKNSKDMSKKYSWDSEVSETIKLLIST